MATKKSAKNGDEVLNVIVEIHKASQKMKLPAASKSKAIAKGVDVCQTYLKIRPFLEMILNFPLIPKKIKDAVRQLMAVLDTLCPR